MTDQFATAAAKHAPALTNVASPGLRIVRGGQLVLLIMLRTRLAGAGVIVLGVAGAAWLTVSARSLVIDWLAVVIAAVLLAALVWPVVRPSRRGITAPAPRSIPASPRY
ncbi:MAG: hypothetical protein AAF467_09110 [Actinomycetota bacterium]